MTKQLNGRTAFLMGASRGIGRSVALRLAKEGMQLGLAARKQADLDLIAAEIASIGGRCLTFAFDVLETEQLERAMQATEEAFGPISVFYNGVGVAPNGSIESLTYEEISRTIDINVKGIIFGTKVAIPFLKRSGGGNILNVSSLAATRGLGTPPDYNGVYPATKWAVNGFDDSMEKYLVSRYNIHVTTLMPGSTATSLWDNKPLPFEKEQMIPPDYIADVVATVLQAPDSVVFKQVRLAAAVEIDLF